MTLCVSGIEEERKALYKLRRTIENQMAQVSIAGSPEVKIPPSDGFNEPLKDPEDNLLFLSFDEEYIMDEMEKSYYVEETPGENGNVHQRENDMDMVPVRGGGSGGGGSGKGLLESVKGSPIKFVFFLK